MDVGRAISQLIAQRGIPKKALVVDGLFTRSRLTRILGGYTEVTYKEIMVFCEYIGVSLNEFQVIAASEDESYKMNLKYREFVAGIDKGKTEEAQQVVEYYRNRKYDNTKFFLMYLRVENFLTPKVAKKPFKYISDSDVDFILSNIGNSDYLSGTDIYILAGTMLDLPYKYLKKVFLTYFPIDRTYIFSVGEEERKAILEFLSNFFDRAYIEKDFLLAENVLDMLSEFLNYFSNLRFMLMEKMNRLFLKLTDELDHKSIDEIRVYVEALYKIGDTFFAQSLEEQLDDLLKRKEMTVSNEKMRSD